MATETVAHPLSWYPTLADTSAASRADRKLEQAEALAQIMLAEDFRHYQDAIQHRCIWLLSDLLTEAREARDLARRESAQREA